MPLFRRYAMARPNARSSHQVPVPQGGGAALVVVMIVVLVASVFLGLRVFDLILAPLGVMAAAITLLAVLGAVDDIKGLPVLPRLVGQVLAVSIVVYMGLSAGRLFPLPWFVEFILLVLAGTWFVNLTNFMDGIDGITLADFMPLAAACVFLAEQGYLTPTGNHLAICFLGVLAGFVFFNWPRARLFLGDVGSLPIGLIGGALLLELAQHGLLAAAIILPLYPFTDATITLVKRLIHRERVFDAHRQHAYQNAVDGGWSHRRVSAIVLVLNLGLAMLACLTIGRSSVEQIALVGLALLSVLAVITLFRRQGKPT